MKPTRCYSLEIHNQSAATRANDDFARSQAKVKQLSEVATGTEGYKAEWQWQ